MRIALSTSVIQRGKTGVAQYVFALVRALLEHADKHEIFLLVLEEDMPLFEFARGKMTLVPVAEKWRSAVKNIFWHQFLLPLWLKRERMDVLHVPSYRRMPLWAPCAKVATIHDLAPFHIKGKYDILRTLYCRVFVKQLARNQDAIVAISQNTARDIETHFGIPAPQQHIILNGLEHERFNPAPASPPAGLEKPFFLYISRLEHPAKNHVRLIEAFNRFKAATGSPWQLALGGSDWHGAEVIHATAKASPYRDDIKFLGFVSDAALPDLYRSAGAMVYPSLFEGFGMPPVEAMACGCPVISSGAGSLDEVVGDAAMRIDPESIESIEQALTIVASDEDLRWHLVTKGLVNARRFDWQDNAAKLMQTYFNVAVLPPTGGIEARQAKSDPIAGILPPHEQRLRYQFKRANLQA